MIEFITKNYEWIFSGIGVLIISGLFSFFKKRKSSNQQNTNINNKNISLVKSNNNDIQIIGTQIHNKYETQEKRSNDSEFVDIEPIKIKEKIASSPLYLQDEIANSFVGIRIKWTLKLFHISKTASNKINVGLEPFESMYPDVNFDVDIENYPIFKIAENGHIFEVTGKISKCDKHHIQIELESIKGKNSHP